MKAQLLGSIAAVALLGGSAVYAASKTTDTLEAAVKPGELVLTGSEVKKIHESKDPSEYKVCVKAEKEAASMKLMYDQKEAVLKPGECKTVIARKIDATPAKALTGDTHIMATFQHVKPAK